jgi:hypothetical protein
MFVALTALIIASGAAMFVAPPVCGVALPKRMLLLQLQLRGATQTAAASHGPRDALDFGTCENNLKRCVARCAAAQQENTLKWWPELQCSVLAELRERHAHAVALVHARCSLLPCGSQCVATLGSFAE